MATATLAAGTAAVAWLCGTTAGARWLLTEVSRHTALKITARTVEGRLLDHLRLTGVRAILPLRETELDSLELRWQPLLLLSGQVAVRELTLNGVVIRDNSPAGTRPLELSWPRLPATTQLFDVSIVRLRVDRFSYQRQGGRPVTIDTFTTSVDWRDMLLSLDGLDVASSAGRLTGKAAAGFRHPSLDADLGASLARPLARMDRLSIHTRLLPGRGPEQVAGSFAISGAEGTLRRLGLTGEAVLTRGGVTLRRLLLERPGRRGRISGEGGLTLTGREPLLKLRVMLAGLDLAPDLRATTDLAGEVTFEGGLAGYRGSFDLANRGPGWRTARASGSYRSTKQGMRLTSLRGVLLDGTVGGDLDIDWENGLALRGSLRARGLDPARIAPDWKGVINADLGGAVAFPPHAPPHGDLSTLLLESSLHGQPLTGRLRAVFRDNTLSIPGLALHGKGFDITAQGALDSGLALTARISDLSRLIPGTGGEFQGAGRVRWHDGRLGGSVRGSGRALQADGMRIASANLTARLGEGTGYPLHLAAALRSVHYGGLRADSATVAADGTLTNHALMATVRAEGAEGRVELSSSYEQGGWHGRILRLSGRDAVGPWSLDAPVALAVSGGRVSIAPLVIRGVGPERVSITVDLTRAPLGGNVRAQLNGVNLARANYWLQGIKVGGTGDGSLRLDVAPQQRLTVAASVALRGTFTRDGHTINVRRGQLTLNGSGSGLRAGIDLRLTDGGLLKGTFSSSAPARPALPDTGSLTLEWSALDLALLHPWLPEGSTLAGKLAGHAAGRVLADRRLQLDGTATLSPTTVHLRTKGGEFNTTVRAADVSWSWHGESLAGTTSMKLAEYGQVRASFQLPFPARLPTTLNPQGPIRASLTGRFREQGLLTSLFPGMIRESHGDVDGNLNVVGTWQQPQMTGSVHLAHAEAYLLTAGIHVTGVRLDARLEKDLIRIDTFRAESGPGRLEGTAIIHLNGWRVTGYTGNLNGDRFQVIYLPEVRLLAAPKLTFEGTSGRLAVRGEIRVPELLVQGPPLSSQIVPSKDVVIEGAPPPPSHTFPLALDIRVRVIPGDKVQVKMEGIDAQLEGSIDLVVLGPDKITSTGEIRVVKGHYKAYGIDLEIVRGRVFYAGGSIDKPTLDILALRTVGDVKAGVTVTGSPKAPLVKLYSEPAMADTDTLAYIVLGHPLGTSSSDQIGLLAQAAGLLLSSSNSLSLKDQLQNRLGLSTLELQTQGATTSHMGYSAIPVAPPGTTTPQATSSLSQSVATAGKYLTPELYVSYGRSLMTGSNLVRLRYDISRRWQIETETGTESGADIYYKIEFK